MSTAIRKGLLTWAKKIGRWLIEHLAAHGITMLVGYMSGKIGDFRRRLAKAKTDRRRAWLRGRIRRWTAAVKWLNENFNPLIECGRTGFDQLAKGDARGIPMDCERLARAA